MLRHIVLLTWKPDVPASVQRATKEAITGLRASCAEIRELRAGDHVGKQPNSHDFAIVMDFEDRPAFERYLASPAHQNYVEQYARPAVAALVSVQHEW